MQEKIFYEIDFTTSGILGQKGAELARKMPKCDGIVLYVWCAPETVKELENTFKVPILNFNSTQIYVDSTKRAYELASKWAEEGPLGPSGYPILKAIETSVADELSFIYFKEAIRDIVRQQFNGSKFDGSRVVFKRFPSFNSVDRRNPSSFFDYLKKIQDQVLNFDSLVQSLINSIDKDFRLRARVNRYLPAPLIKEGGIWLFSSYENFTKALIEHGAVNANFLLSRTRGMSETEKRGAHPTVNLWRFSKKSSVSTPKEAATNALSSFDSVTDSFRKIGYGKYLDSLKKRIFDSVLSYFQEERLIITFVEAVKPKELWVANQWGSERLLIHVAKSHSIPITQVQHGFPSIYYRFSPIATDKTLITTRRWENYFNTEVEVTGKDLGTIKRSELANKIRNVTVFSTPFHLVKLFNSEISTYEVMRLATMLSNKKLNVTLRVHPNDSRRKWQESINKNGLRGKVTIDKKTKIEQILKHTDLGIAYFSTSLEDCERNSVPAVGLLWQLHPGWNELRSSDLISTASSIYDVIKEIANGEI